MKRIAVSVIIIVLALCLCFAGCENNDSIDPNPDDQIDPTPDPDDPIVLKMGRHI